MKTYKVWYKIDGLPGAYYVTVQAHSVKEARAQFRHTFSDRITRIVRV